MYNQAIPRVRVRIRYTGLKLFSNHKTDRAYIYDIDQLTTYVIKLFTAVEQLPDHQIPRKTINHLLHKRETNISLIKSRVNVYILIKRSELTEICYRRFGRTG